MNRLLEDCEREQPWLLALIEALVAIESPSGDAAAISRALSALESRLDGLGGTLTRVTGGGAGDHLKAEFGAGARKVLLLGHIDTVWPAGTLDERPFRREDGKLYGPGVFDMKAGLALAALAIRAVRLDGHAPPGRVTLLVTADEETGSGTSRALIEAEARSSDAVFVLEPALPGGSLKTSRKGCGGFALRVAGRAAHAGIEPERGASAVSELVVQLARVEALRDEAEGTSINVGVIRGGTRPNVVAADAEALIDVRVATAAEAARLTAALGGLTPRDPRTRLTVEGGFDRQAMERSAATARLFALAREVAAGFGRDLGEGGTGGGSDGNLTAAIGVPTLDGLGAVGGGAHAVDEHVTSADLPWRAALLAGLIRRILAD